MKPKPFASLNHFTTPLMRDMNLSSSRTGANCDPDLAATQCGWPPDQEPYIKINRCTSTGSAIGQEMCTSMVDELELNDLPVRALRGTSDVSGEPAAVAAAERYLRPWRWGRMSRIALNRARARRATEWPATTIARDQVERLGRVIRVRTRLSHAPSR